MKRKTHFKIATFNNIGSNLLTEVKPFENHVQFIFDFAAIPTRAGLFYLKNHFTGIIFSQKTYMYVAKANFYFTGVGKALHGKSLVIPKAKLVQSQ